MEFSVQDGYTSYSGELYPGGPKLKVYNQRQIHDDRVSALSDANDGIVPIGERFLHSSLGIIAGIDILMTRDQLESVANFLGGRDSVERSRVYSILGEVLPASGVLTAIPLQYVLPDLPRSLLNLLPPILPPRITSGPNCLNAVRCWFDGQTNIEYESDENFKNYLQRYFKPVRIDREPRWGDVRVVYRKDDSVILHAAVHLNKDFVFEKASWDDNSHFGFREVSEAFHRYRGETIGLFRRKVSPRVPQ
ncbi:MAG: hypothetical protein AB7G93_01275 [Bdellovibrionales bacterium]